MKNLLIVLSICAIGCKEKGAVTPAPITRITSDDTCLFQRIHVYKGIYYLQTTVKTQREQNALSDGEDVLIMVGDSYAPYNYNIHGTFDFISRNKQREYEKGKHYYDSIKQESRYKYPIMRASHITDSLRDDSVKLLNKIPVK